MTTTVGSSNTFTDQASNVFTRLALVLTSPAEAYARVAARPTALPALAVVALVMALCQFLFLSTAVGQQALVDQQVRTMSSFGMTVTPEMESRLQSDAARARYMTAGSQFVALPIAAAIVAALLLVIFNASSDEASTFKHVYAVVAHSGVVMALSQIVLTPISYLMGEFANVTRLSVFFPMLDPDGVISFILGGVELFMLWWLANLSIGIAVLYKRPTRGVTIIVIGSYAALVVVVAAIRAAF